MTSTAAPDEFARPRHGDHLDLEVTDLAFGGQGVARHGSFVVFVNDAAPGDLVRARVWKSRRRFAEADLVEVLRPSPNRVTPPCQYVGRCGGCRLQHVDAAVVLEAKRSQIVEHLARIGHLTGIDVREPIPALAHFGYRNKMEYSAGPDENGGLRLGFHRRGRWDEVVDLASCLLASPLGNRIRERVRQWALAEGMPPYDQRAQTGILRHVVVREAPTTGQALVMVVTAPGAEAAVDRLAAPLMADIPEVVGLVHGVNDGVSEITQDIPTRHVAGLEAIEERVLGVTLRLSMGAFFQTNTLMAERLYAETVAAAGLTGGEVLYDLYAGAGSIGLVLAPSAKEVISIEIVEDAVRDANANAAANGITNFRSIAGDCGVVLREQRDELPAPDVVVVDPPRGGLSGRAVRRILELSPPTLVYVSCQPATFADNAKRFVDGGYTLEYVQPVDMFPQTPHIEAVARFVR